MLNHPAHDSISVNATLGAFTLPALARRTTFITWPTVVPTDAPHKGVNNARREHAERGTPTAGLRRTLPAPARHHVHDLADSGADQTVPQKRETAERGTPITG